ncbi:efflux RND transporter periplasmic adaptor subunit [Agrobacterium sp. LAD9]|uniref:efflux RND transporter periplasmic adaptor subunit n=1 Tax=Agrobacterium sp. LAD9 TaxID=2055153 RepID=UPI000D1E112D|nr:efflux RND transporter periplasmic adaptor subunit [Agrobacterium sp. LAD9]
MRNIIITRLAFLSAVLLSACSEEEPAPKPPRPIKSLTVHAELVGETMSQTGEVRPRYETPLGFRLEGQLTQRLENGTPVRAGDVLATIDKTPSQNKLLVAKAELASAESAENHADTVAARNWELFPKNAISKAQLQESDANFQVAKARLEAARASLAAAEQELSFTELKAPRNGIVSAVGANEGQVVSVGTMVITLISDSERDAVFDVPETLLSVEPPLPVVEVSLISNPAVSVTGRVREITPSADATTRTYRAKVSLEGAGQLPFGAAVSGKIVVSSHKLFRVPASALLNRTGKTTVYVYDKTTSQLRGRTIEVERFDANDLFISNGLVDGDIVATAGVLKLREGEIVTLEEKVGK